MARQSVKVFAPAAVGNVAVGFDILGFAINGVGDDVIAKRGIKPGLVITEITGAKGKLPFDPEKNTAGHGALRLLEAMNATQEPIELSIHKKMPIGSGLGSSAASAVAGVFAVHELMKFGLDKRDLLPYAMLGEQIATNSYQADNVAPSLLGGMTLIRDNATLDVHKLYIPRGLQAVVIYPHVEILTKNSRDILSKEITLQQHIIQSGNLGGFILGMYNTDFDLIKRSLHDVVIEPQRAKLIPCFYEMKEKALLAGALGFSVSGGGPSMFALCNNSLVAEQIVEDANILYKSKKIRINTYTSDINHEGAYMY